MPDKKHMRVWDQFKERVYALEQHIWDLEGQLKQARTDASVARSPVIGGACDG